MEGQQNVRFGLRGIKEESFSLANDQIIDGNINVANLQYKYSTVTEISPKEDKILIRASLSYFSSEVHYFALVITMEYFVENLRGVVSYNLDSRQVSFNPNLIPTFLNITCGTVRGILAEKVKGKTISQFPLPLLPLAALEKNNNITIKD